MFLAAWVYLLSRHHRAGQAGRGGFSFEITYLIYIYSRCHVSRYVGTYVGT